MQIVTIDGSIAVCESRGISREVNLFLLQGIELEAGDCVMVHVGYAIQKVDLEDAQERWKTFSELLMIQEKV